MTNKFKHISDEEMEKRFMTFLENTKDNQLTTEEQQEYARSFFRYMATEEDKNSGLIRTSLNIRPGEKLRRALGYVFIVALFAMLVFTIIAGIFTFTSDVDLAMKITYPALLGVILILVSTIVNGTFVRLSKNVAKFAASRKIKVGDLYFYDMNCRAKSSMIYSPIVVQVIDVIDRDKILAVSCTDGQYILIADPSLLIPFRKTAAQQMADYCMVRLPGNLPLINEDDLTVIDACIVNAKNNKQDQLVTCLLDLKGRITRYAFDPLCQDVSRKHDSIIEFFNDIVKISRKVLCNDGAVNDPYVGELAGRLKESICKTGEKYFGDGEDMFNFVGTVPIPEELNDFLKSFGSQFRHDTDGYYDDEDDENDI